MPNKEERHSAQKVLEATTKDKSVDFVVHFPFISPAKKEKKKEREGRKKKSGQQQLNSYISGFVKAE